METKEEILKKHENLSKGSLNGWQKEWVYNAMQEYSDKQNKILSDNLNDYIKKLKDTFDLVYKLDEQKNSEWISIEDKLPNHREQVLGFPKQYPFGLIRECSYEEYTGQDLEWFKEAFSHWMPLPNKPISTTEA